MASTVYVCFPCRITQRANKHSEHQPWGICPRCRKDMVSTFGTTPIPKKNDDEAWKTFENKMRKYYNRFGRKI